MISWHYSWRLIYAEALRMLFPYNGAGDCLWVSFCGLISGSQTIPRVYMCVRTKTTREKLKETVIVAAIVNETKIWSFVRNLHAKNRGIAGIVVNCFLVIDRSYVYEIAIAVNTWVKSTNCRQTNGQTDKQTWIGGM